MVISVRNGAIVNVDTIERGEFWFSLVSTQVTIIGQNAARLPGTGHGKRIGFSQKLNQTDNFKRRHENKRSVEKWGPRCSCELGDQQVVRKGGAAPSTKKERSFE